MDVMDDEEEDSLADNFDRALSETMAAKEDIDREVSLPDRSVCSVSCCLAGLLESALLRCNLPGRLSVGILGCTRKVDMRTFLRQFGSSVQSPSSCARSCPYGNAVSNPCTASVLALYCWQSGTVLCFAGLCRLGG